jgi:hypothetical protein
VEHTQKHHQSITSKELIGMKDHIAKSFGAAALISELNLPDTLTDVLPMKDLHAGEHPPVLAQFKCLVMPSCSVWCASNKPSPNISITHKLSHYIWTHNTSIKNYDILQLVMMQKLRLRGCNYHTFVLPKDWIIASTVQFPLTFNF